LHDGVEVGLLQQTDDGIRCPFDRWIEGWPGEVVEQVLQERIDTAEVARCHRQVEDLSLLPLPADTGSEQAIGEGLGVQVREVGLGQVGQQGLLEASAQGFQPVAIWKGMSSRVSQHTCQLCEAARQFF